MRRLDSIINSMDVSLSESELKVSVSYEELEPTKHIELDYISGYCFHIFPIDHQ